jgi:DNA modification methylase
MNSLILGDNLQILQNIESESVDLCYIDPPFFSNRTYEVIWGDKGEVRSFEDRFSGGVDHYISWLKERVVEIHRVLKPTGSFYLHCDWHADAYIRVYILDKIFGEGKMINHFVWKRSTTSSSISKAARKNHDSIFLYSKSNKYTFNQQFQELSEGSKKMYKNQDERGFFRYVPLTVSGKRNGKTGEIWRGIDPNKLGQAGMYWVTTPEKIEKYDEQKLVYFGKDGKGIPQLKYYLEDNKGVPIAEIWDDINLVSGNEAIGYPTQKPEKLLERIIKASSNEGDVVLDCFLGGGTTIAVADKLGRRWIGIDQSVQAVKVSEFRLNRQQSLFSEPFEVRLHKYDYDTLRYKDAFEFETWIVEQFGGVANIKQRGDLGLDGKDKDGKAIQVKRSDGIGRNVVDNFVSAAKRYDKNIFEKAVKNGKIVGTIIAFSFGKGAVQEVARLRNEDKILINLVKVEEIVAIAKKPNVKLIVELLEKTEKTENYKFVIKATVEIGQNIEFHSFEIAKLEKEVFESVFSDYQNKTGILEMELKLGKYKIIAKAVDNNGLTGSDEVEIVVGKVENAI